MRVFFIKQSSMSGIISHRCAMLPALLAVMLCLLRETDTALLSSQSSDDVTRNHLPTATARPPVTASVPSGHLGLLETPTSPRWRQRRSDPHGSRSPRANLTLKLGGQLLLSRQTKPESSISRPPPSNDDPEVPSGSRGQAEAPPAGTIPASPASGRHGQLRTPLTTEQQSRRLPPEFLAFPVYWSSGLSGRQVDGGGGRKPALESPLADQLVTTTAAPQRGKTTHQPPPATPSVPVEMILAAPPAGCDAPGGPPSRLASRCTALRQLRQQTRQLRRQAAQQQAQQRLQRIIDLHLADVADSLVSRSRQAVPTEVNTRASTSTSGTVPGRQNFWGYFTPLPSTFEDVALLKARKVPPPLSSPQTVTKTPSTQGKRRRQSTQGSLPVTVSPLTSRRPKWVSVGVSSPGDGLRGDGSKTGRRGGGQGSGATEKSHLRDADRPQRQSRWKTYSSVSPNSIRTAPDKPETDYVSVIDPLPTEPASLFTTTIVPVGGMPITQKGVIPGLLDIPARVYFSCRDRRPGFYGNPQTGCQVYHQCTADGKKYDYLCGVGTAFSSDTNTCDHWYNMSCDGTN